MVASRASRARRGGGGFTLPELLIVTAVLSVLLAAGAPHLADFMRNQRVKTASFDLFSSLVLARSEAITRNTRVTVAPAGGSWANGWTITETGGTVLRRQEAVSNVTINGPAAIVYVESGRLNAATWPEFELAAAGAGVVQRCIRIDLSGRPVSKSTPC
ncbi:MAG TPA: GspH/FimT family pseudopilin [Burkholderiales bacterium]|nr:GspH/FimT family pseudopilin [Burkholderiales bacterium]